MISSRLSPWLVAPVLNGRLALLFSILAVALPTAVRAAINGQITGCEFTPYLPFVLLTAIMVGWRQATLVALASVAILGGLFAGTLHQFFDEACVVSAAGIFLASSAIIIGVVMAIRHVMAELQSRRTDSSAGGIIFSLDKGEVWASWNGSGAPLRLGSQEKVEAMMEDFLAQGELGKRLNELAK